MITQEELRVVIGVGEHNNNSEWIQTQESDLNLLKRDDWEHLSYEEGREAARICFDFLKPGGYIRCAVPDGFLPDEEYQKVVQVGGPGPKDHPAATHKIIHNYHTLTSMFEEAGFAVELLEHCDENGEFFYNKWDEKQGFIYRSKRFDHRNKSGKLGFVSLIVDAVKPNI